MAELSDNSSVSALALRFLILTATRTNEVLQAQWQEIDREAAVWTIHRRPDEDPARTPGAAVRCGSSGSAGATLPRRQSLSLSRCPSWPPSVEHGPAAADARHGVRGQLARRGHYVPHGFRSSFRDWSGEVSSFPRDVAEMALAHVIENKVEAAYRRGDLFAKRRKMMQEWAAYVGKPQAEVIPIGTHA